MYSSLDFRLVLNGNVQTLSTHNAPENDPIQGLLFVPSLNPNDPCNDIAAPFVPPNVTRKEDVSPFGDHSIALAPWISVECTHSFLNASQHEEPDALIFFLPAQDNKEKPPPPDDPTWVLGDSDEWKDRNEFPVYAIPGPDGATLMQRLSWYSGDATSTSPHENGNSAVAPHRHHHENVRLFTFIDLAKNGKKMPSLWGFVLAILGTILVLSMLLLVCYQIVQKRRRRRLRRRIEAGDADLESLGLNQMKVPQEIVDQLPKYTFPDVNAPPEALLPGNMHSHHTKFFTDGHGSITTIEEEPEDRDEIDADHGSHVQRPQPATTTTTTANTTTTTINQPISTTPSVDRLSYSQTTCAICLDDYEPGLSIVREMPCGHIFDAHCIDTFLTQNSSLCPLCKKSVLPSGTHPIPVTNVMVQRDYMQRRTN
ncbi:uncharacterized protein EURHEDRAFT_93521 [Aspergillus ruber CBS 135680]|uniref:RING-type E3 ubiquitin transferase n=1 Tax=Aspergillus ruber (strain CBS 135680) TaxID=1388766 RepID=A0A017SC33_ASPRC|nr:uncharacterized protein EURHEDRAFT_93521 [Aspergillus ruber CBS 135680]EYE94492.1 hypothetical protein EURHEDRAFT_93521 [Aspergillus ruber CBS 135680]